MIEYPEYPNTHEKIINNFYFIKIESLKEEKLEECKRELYVQSLQKNYITDKITVKFDIIEKNEHWLALPPEYGIEKFGRPEINNTGFGEKIDLTSNIKSYRTDYPQEKIINETTKKLLEDGSCQLCLDTGLGKTVCSIDIISRLSRKTLIVVHKVDLIEQWKKKIEEYLPGAIVGIMKGSKKIDIEGKDIVFVTVQSLSKVNYKNDLLNQFGFVICDEIHLMAAETFHKAFKKASFRYRLGLSATPIRKDGLSCVIKWFFGPILFQLKQPRSDIKVIVHHYRDGTQQKRWIGYGDRKKPDKTKMITDLIDDELRNKILIERACEMSSKNVQTLILTDRINHVIKLSECIRKSIEKVDVDNPRTVGTLLGKLSQEEREANKKCDIICATTKMAKDSLDLENLGNMIIATPISSNDIQQIRGRLLRKTISSDDHRPHLFILFDDWEESTMFTGLFWKTHHFLKREGYEIVHVD